LQTQTRTNALTGLPETLVTQFQYDGNGKLTGTLHPDGSLNQTFYTRLGKVDHTIDAAGHLRQYVYDSLGQQIMAFNPTNSGSSNGYTQTVYDFDGNPTQQIDQKGRITQTSYDGLGRAYRMQQLGTAASPLATPITTTTAYDGAGNVVSETDANGNTTQHAYDAANNKMSDTDALGNVTNYDYDENNRLTSVTEPPQTHASYAPVLIQRTTTYFYDQVGRQTMTILPDKVTATVTGYDELNRRTSFTDGSNRTTTYGYDDDGRLTSVTDNGNNTWAYQYDEVGERIAQMDPNGHVTRFAFDQMGRMVSRTLPGLFTNNTPLTESFAYNPDGTTATHTDFTGLQTTYSYWPSGLLKAKTAPTGSIQYWYDNDQRRKGAERTVQDPITNQPDTTRTRWTYDAQTGRLDSITTPNGVVNYTYDAAGVRHEVASVIVARLAA